MDSCLIFVSGFLGFVCQDKVLFAADCDPNPCLAGGTCFGFSRGHFCCTCPPDRTGAKCEDGGSK